MAALRIRRQTYRITVSRVNGLEDDFNKALKTKDSIMKEYLENLNTILPRQDE